MALELNTNQTTWAEAASEINKKALDKTGAETIIGRLFLSKQPTEDMEVVTKSYAETQIIITGSYNGSHSGETRISSQIINLGFTPRAVLVVPADGLFSYITGVSGHRIFGGLAVTGSDAVGLRIVPGGFEVSTSTQSDNLGEAYYLNSGVLNYIAVR